MSFRGDSGMPSYKRGAYMDTGEVAEWKKMDLRPDPLRQNQMRTGSRSPLQQHIVSKKYFWDTHPRHVTAALGVIFIAGYTA